MLPLRGCFFSAVPSRALIACRLACTALPLVPPPGLSLLLRLLAPVDGIAAPVHAFVLHAAFRCACVGHIASQACWQGRCLFIMAAASFCCRFAVFCSLVTVGAALPSASTVDAQMIRNSCLRPWPALCVVQPCFVLQAIVLQAVSHAAAANAAYSNSERHHGGGVACGFVCSVALLLQLRERRQGGLQKRQQATSFLAAAAAEPFFPAGSDALLPVSFAFPLFCAWVSVSSEGALVSGRGCED